LIVKSETSNKVLLREKLRHAVLSGAFKIGDRFDSERNLAREYGVPRNLVGRVLDSLAEEGLVDRKVGRGGTIVLSNQPTHPKMGFRQMSFLLTHFRSWSATDNYFYDIIHGAQDAAKEAGFSLTLWSPPRDKSPAQALEDALAICTEIALVEEEFDDEFVACLQNRNILPIVVNRPSRLPVDTVRADNPSGIRQAMDYLYQLGHRQIGYLGNLHDPNNEEREKSFLASSHQLGLDPAQRVLSHYVDSRKLLKAGLTAGEIALVEESRISEEFLRNHTALLCSNDYVARVVYRKAANLGLRIPQELSVIGFCDIALAESLTPKLTSVKVDSGQIGRRAVQVFLDRQKNPENPKVHSECIPVELHPRESCSRPTGSPSNGQGAFPSQ
jgi:DNA-binding LacI/PurR family transcriptional regulator